jgi:hypothetical protein
VREPAAAVLRLPHGRGVPVQFRAERGQQSLEGDVGVRCLGERRGDPGDLDDHLVAVGVQDRDLAGPGGRQVTAFAQQPGETQRVGGPQVFRYEHCQRAALQHGRFVAQECAQCRIGIHDAAVPIDDDHDVRQRFEKSRSGDERGGHRRRLPPSTVLRKSTIAYGACATQH